MANEGSFWSYQEGRWNRTKFILRCISLVLSIIIIGVSIADSVLIASNGADYTFLLDWWFTLPIILISTGLDAVEFICIFARKRNPGLHPGFHIGTELVLLGGNITALVFLSSSIPTEFDYRNYYFPALSGVVRPLKITIIFFVGIFSIVRFILFVFGSVDTNRHHTAAQVELIVRALRQQNINEPMTPAQVHNAIYPNRQPIPLHEYPQAIRPSHETYNKPEYYRELPDNQKFLGDLPTLLKST